MFLRLVIATLSFVIALPTQAWAACQRGVYGTDQNNFVVLGASVGAPTSGQRYLFRNGTRGSTGDAKSPISCAADVVTYRSPDGQVQRLPRAPTIETRASFESVVTRLAGQLIEPAGSRDAERPLVVLVHGSEKSAAIGNVYAYMLAAQGVSVFVYDKRGTGESGGDYTQNFELLADDAAAALAQARQMAAGRFGRAGFFGGSQGGWVAPLAATRSQADFVAVAFGLAISPVEEDREQLLGEARSLGLDTAAIAHIERLSRATARLVRTHFAEGYTELASVKREIADAPWASRIHGEYSGDMLRMNDTDLRRIGRARFDNLELIWDYDAAAALKRLSVPLLWVLAGEDREAPIATTRATLSAVAAAGQPVQVYLFPDTDHGMFEFRTEPDGTRVINRITDGYLRLLADWFKGTVQGIYGRAERIR